MGQEESTLLDDSVPPHTLTERSLSAVASYIKDGPKKRIVVLTGAGISTAAGIPDFRSPKTGLYNNLARLKLPYAEAVFDISYFRQHPEPFYVLAQELYPGKFHPTVSHAFISLLAKKGLLQMLFTQNIDCLERAAGVPSDRIIEAHGSFATQRCIECKKEFPDDDMKKHVADGKVPHCKESGCNGTVKPDIVFFGEALPSAFGENSFQTSLADVVLILGTSLTVYPFAGLPDLAKSGKPRVLFNMERVGNLGSRTDDVIELGSCDEGIRKLADELGWRDELEKLWREIVGDEEAERQLRTPAQHEEEVEDEVNKLTGEVEAALNFDTSESESSEDEDASSAKGEDHKTSNADPALDEPEKEVGDAPSDGQTMRSTWTEKPEQHANASSEAKEEATKEAVPDATESTTLQEPTQRDSDKEKSAL